MSDKFKVDLEQQNPLYVNIVVVVIEGWIYLNQKQLDGVKNHL